MADTGILGLPVAITIDGSEWSPAVQGGVTKRYQLGLVPAANASATSQTANTFLAGPISGLLSTPFFRAIVAADILGALDGIGGVQGDVLFRGASSWQALAPSTSGFVLSTQGAGQNPTWVSSTTNGVTHLSSSTGAVSTTAQKKLDQELNFALDFGADPTGVTAVDGVGGPWLNFVAAIAATGVPGFVPPGNYLFNSTSAAPSVTPTGAFVLRGAGAASILNRSANSLNPLLVINSASNPIVRDIAFKYSGIQPYSNIVGVSLAATCVITTAVAHPFVNGQSVVIYDIAGTTQLNGGPYTVAGCPSASGSNGTTFQLSGINSTTYSAYVSGGEVSLSNQGGHEALQFNQCVDPFLENATITGQWWVGAEMRNCDGGTFAFNKISNNGDRGLYVQITGANVSRKVRIIGNDIDGGGSMFYGINTNVASTATEQDIIIANNTIYNTLYQGIAISGAAYGVITGNVIDTVSSSSGVGILIQTTNTLTDKFITCTGNTINNASTGIAEITSQNSLISCNTITCSSSNGFYGIQLSGSTNPTVVGNKIKTSVNNMVGVLAATNGATAMTGGHVFGNHIVMSGTTTTGISSDASSTGNMAQNFFSGPATNISYAGTWTFGDALALTPPSGTATLQTVKSLVNLTNASGISLTLNPTNGYQHIGFQANGTPQGALGYGAGLYVQNAIGNNILQFIDGTSASTLSVNYPTLTAGTATGAAGSVIYGAAAAGSVPSTSVSHLFTPVGIGGLGYTAGAGVGGTVTQATSKSTGATLNKATGTITMNGAALAAATTVGFTFTNSVIAATDLVFVNIKSGATANSYTLTVSAVAAGSCVIELRNTSAGSLSESVVLNFVVFKGASS